MKNIGLVIGTRPEAIKVAPLVHALNDFPELSPHVILSGQHGDVVNEVLAAFDIETASPLLTQAQRSLTELSADLLVECQREFDRLELDMVVVHGDTTTAFAAGLAAFLNRIPVTHLEAGLRSGSLTEPFPEEFNRMSIDSYAEICLAPTSHAEANLLDAGVDEHRIHVTGNTVIDALHTILDQQRPPNAPQTASALDHQGKLILATAHRRESWGAPMTSIMRAVAEVARRNKDAVVAFAMHPNPALQKEAHELLSAVDNVVLLPPVSYGDLALLLDRATLVLTDSGGIQEEACALNTPTIVLRERTERPEAIEAGIATLAGSSFMRILKSATEALSHDHIRSYQRNVFGDGQARHRCAKAIAYHFGLDARPARFYSPADLQAEVSL